MTMNYGVKILSINIISAKPKDDTLMASLALGNRYSTITPSKQDSQPQWTIVSLVFLPLAT